MTPRGLHRQSRIDHYTQAGLWTGDTVDGLLRARVAARPGALAVVDPANKAQLTGGLPRRLTWGELDAEVDRVAAVLVERGFGHGDVLALQLPNTAELCVTFLAAFRIGAVVTPFPVQYREYELAQLVRLAGARGFVTCARLGDRPMADTARDLAAAVDGLDTVAIWGGELATDEFAADGGAGGLVGLDTAQGDPGRLTAHLAGLTIDPGECLTICWTSGTEATPKGVPRCHHDWLATARVCTAAPNLTGDDVVLNPFPMVNMAGIAGVFLPWLISGCALVQHQPFDLPVFLGQIAAERVTYTLVPPALLTMLLQREEVLAATDISSLTRVGSGSAPLPPSMVRGWQERHGIAVINFFGSNEGVALLSDPVSMPDPVDRASFFPRPGLPGVDYPSRVLAATESRLVDVATGEDVTEPGQPGELLVRGPTVFAGYLPGTATRESVDGDGWLHTGDVFEIAGDAGQYLRYLDRAKDVIIRGGMNIAPAEIESLLSGHPKVADVACVGYPDEVLGERVCVFAVARPGEQITLDELVGHLRERRVASYKLPERLEIAEALPRNPVGKILKRELRSSLEMTP
ncbi:class I adenylate-forming enzyme family protein [Nocardia aurea]|uniref:class I adenylate-forming enzyme family protein n=1 Tax=Nocardia aurea TaxID=2144174 RepID=UPI000D68D2A9|nr:class I adenylate-forming enzyme family protein [Nocardia aurea]